MNYSEHAIQFDCGENKLTGVIAVPAMSSATGVVVIVGGPQYRAGSHRQFVLLSRTIAADGFPVLRFDYRGMGDSEGECRNFESIAEDIGSAIDALQRFAPQVMKIVLWGLCDAAAAALLYLSDKADPRVHGLCLLNPWVRSEASLARAHVKHYYATRLREKAFWKKLMTGQVARRALTELWDNIFTMLERTNDQRSALKYRQFQDRMAHVWTHEAIEILLLLSGNDYTAKEFLEYTSMHHSWRGHLTGRHVTRRDFKDADHTFSSAVWREQVSNATSDWLKRI